MTLDEASVLASAGIYLSSEDKEGTGHIRMAHIKTEHESDEALAVEISQLLYHLQVLMIARGLSLEDIYRKL